MYTLKFLYIFQGAFVSVIYCFCNGEVCILSPSLSLSLSISLSLTDKSSQALFIKVSSWCIQYNNHFYNIAKS